MVNYPHNNLFNRGDTERQIKIAFSGGTITNKEMHQGSFSLTESLCSEESLRFGTCEASVLQFKVHNVLTPLVGENLTVYEVLNGNTAEPFNYGKYKVQSDKPTADRKYRDVVAYDAMYDILNADVASWYNSLTFPCSIGYFRKQFLKHLDIEYVDTTLVNDGIYIDKTIDAEELSGKTVINAICEINGCFGHINRQGKFEFVVLKPIITGLYPSETLYPSEILYPREANSAELLPKSRYSSCKYEDFETKLITGLHIRQEEDAIGCTVGTTANAYVVQDNFLVYGMDHEELTTVANNLFSVISKIYYRPIEYVKTSGKPYLEVGDNISIGSSEVIIETYILERTISGINGQRDEFFAKGTEYYPKELNGLNKQITQLKGKTNKLIRTVDETRIEMADMEKELYSTITVTASELRTELSNTKSGLESSINQTASQIRLEVSNIENDLQSQITQNANAISLRVTNSEFESEITALDNKISLRVTSSELESEIAILERKINLKVDSGDVINEINISDEAIELNGNRLIVNSTNFKLDAYGNVEVTGYIDATSGWMGGFELSEDGFLINGETILTEYSCYFGDINTDSINGYNPITSGNVWEYLPEISLTVHAEGGYGSYYYSTDSPYASGDNKSIPSIQWVKDYVNSKLSS